MPCTYLENQGMKVQVFGVGKVVSQSVVPGAPDQSKQIHHDTPFMKLLKDILYRSRIVEVIGSTQFAIDSITMDSRLVKPMGLFVAVKGFASDGHVFMDSV
jgi:UDP-N-acetylmuramyl pentapeptide synthase